MIADHGAIVAEFFDSGCSRQMPWHQRPEASALLTVANSSERLFDVMVVGEYERACMGAQFEQVGGAWAVRGKGVVARGRVRSIWMIQRITC